MTAPLSVARLPPRRRRRLGLVVLVLLFAFFLLLSNLVPLAAEWLWFQALGYERVFTTRLVAEAVLGVAVGGAGFAFLYANLRIAQRGLVPNPLVVQVSGAAAVDVTRLLRRLALPTALGLALLFGMGAAGGWLGVLQFLHRTPFGATDPVFGREVGYYVFTLPVIAGAIGLGIAVTTLTLLATIVLYVVRRDIVVFRRQVTVEPSARLHLAVLIALLFVLVALRVYFVRLPGLLYSTTGPLVGASYADLHAQLTGLRLARPPARRDSPNGTSGPTGRPSTTSDCGTATRCSRRSGSCRRSVPITTSFRWTTTATGSTGSTARCSSRRAS